MKIVINVCYGGFTLSDAVCQTLNCNKYDDDLRTSPELIELMETMGSEYCSGDYSELKVVEIPDDVKWEIEEYDGKEWISEIHRTWS